jgi:hypothetical protein
MKIQVQNRYLSLILTVLFVFIISGCSSTTTTKTTTVSTEPAYNSSVHPEYRAEPVVKTTETVETEETSTSCGGIIGCTVEVVGTVLALPFRAVGLLIDVIF